jgi:predicted ATPase/signal transduction histidine kinase
VNGDSIDMPDTYAREACLWEEESGSLSRGVRQVDGAPVLIRAAVAAPRSRALERLRNEYEYLQHLEGRFVLRALALEKGSAQWRLVLEGFAGEPLSSRDAGPMEVGRFFTLAIGLTEALEDLHRQDVVHRDLKPANVLFEPLTGAVKLIGLGLASRPVHVPAAPGSTELIEGSLAYMSPEQTGHMNRGVDHRSDFYSLGVIFYELLTGERPFRAEDPLEWAHCHIALTPRPLAELVPEVPQGLAAVVLKLLAKDAEDRYQSARGLRFDLERCREAWTREHVVAPFPLGSRDALDRFVVSPRLYGREREVAALEASFEAVRSSGSAGFVLVSGYSGIGKSSLVYELRRAVVEARGSFISGKFDQYQRDIPYATLVEAVSELLQQLLTESDERIAQRRAALQEALGTSGQLIVELVPRLELIIGPQPPVAKLPPNEAQHRLHLVFRRFLSVFAEQGHPLVLFLDDLQWLDPASLQLMAHLMASPEPQALLLVGAYRDNEVGPTHALSRTLDEVRRSGVALMELVLRPLSAAHLTQLAADTLRRPPEEVAALAQLVFEKTAGNPFFVIQFMTLLHQERLLAYDERAARWAWDLTAIHTEGFTDNVVELMLGKLKRLSATSQRALMLAACVGSAVDAPTLALVTGSPEEELHQALREATEGGLVWRADDAYRFLHDRVQEAAYALLPPQQRPGQHLQIARLLLAHTPEARLAGRIFEIASQYNRGMALVTQAPEKERLAELNLMAGRRAKASTAFASAASYLGAGTATLAKEAWTSAHELAFALHLELGECEYLGGSYEPAERLLSLCLEMAGSVSERARVYRHRQRLFQLSGRFGEAVSITLQALRLFGVTLPEADEDIEAATDAELELVARNLGGRRIADLAEAPFSVDAEVRTLIGLLAEGMPLIYVSRPALWPLITVKGVNACLTRGHAAESPFVYSCHAMVLVGVCRDIPSALEFSQMALRLNERSPSAAAWRGKLLFHHAAVVNIWARPYSVNLPLLEQAFQACIDSGDLVHAGYLSYNAVWLHLESGEPLDRVVALAQHYEVLARQYHNDVIAEVVRVEAQFGRALQGKTRSLTDLSDDSFDETARVAAIEEAGFGLGVAYHRIMRLVAAYHAGRFEEALEWADRGAPRLLHVASMANEATFHFFHGLTMTALWPEASPARRAVFAQSLEAVLARLELWARHCPENFAARHALVRAEVAGLEGQELEAMRLYERAIGSAREAGLVHDEALALELASRFYRARGLERLAEAALREARACYARWGAEGKVRALDGVGPSLVQPHALTAAEVFSARPEELDLLSVLKASQAISEELALPSLQEKLLRLVLEHAGARAGCLVLAEGETLSLHARAEPLGDATRVELLPGAAVTSDIAPLSLLNYVRRSGDAVVVADASSERRFAGDPYFARRRPRSVLGLPISRQGQLRWILYLENDLVAGAFASEKLAVLELLAAQAAISLETARLYTDLRRENTERQRAEGESRRLNRELEQRVLDRTAQLAAANTELEAFAYSVSHDLRAPLRHIDGFVGLLRKGSQAVLDAQSLHYLDTIEHAAHRMGALIDDLLDFSRMGRRELSRREVDLGEVVRDVLRELEPDTRGRDVRWQVGRLPVVTGDRALLRVVFVNLISNALKFTRPRPRAEIQVEGSLGEGEHVVSIRDNGVGFDPHYAGKLFGVFQRLHREEEFEGTGIGLASVRRIIHRHGGRTWAEGEPDRGAGFFFSLPQTAAEG